MRITDDELQAIMAAVETELRESYEQHLSDAVAEFMATGRTTVDGPGGYAIELDWTMSYCGQRLIRPPTTRWVTVE